MSQAATTAAVTSGLLSFLLLLKGIQVINPL
jgi:hypothetical protein